MIQTSWKWFMKPISLQHRTPGTTATLVFSKAELTLPPEWHWIDPNSTAGPAPFCPSLPQSHPELHQPENKVTPVALPTLPLSCRQPSELLLAYGVPQPPARPTALQGNPPVDLREGRIRACGFSFYFGCLQRSLVIVTLFVHVLALRLAV